MTPEQLKASILQRAMEGKLVLQDPNDEPASELLKKIKAEKEKLIKEGKIKRDKNETEIFRGDDGLHYEKFPDGSVKQIDVPYEIPKSWEWGRLSSVVTLINGDRGKNYPSKDKLFSEGDIPFVNAGNINNNSIVQDNLLYLSQSQYAALGSGKLQFGDIVYCIRGSLGKNGLFTMSQGAIASSLIILRIIGDKSLNTDYFLSYLNSELCKNEILKFDNGTAQPNLSGQNLSKFLIPIPPFEEQLRISSMIKKALVLVNKYTTRYQMLNTLNRTFPEKLRKSILQHAMQGKLVPQDATDEPVEVLLEKIREEKQKLFGEGKLKKKDLQESIICQGDHGLHYEKFQDGTIKQVDIPFEIPESWKWVRLNNIIDVRDGTHKTPKYVKDGVPLLTSKNLINGMLVKEPSKRISLAESNEINKRSKVEENDILLAMIGTIGNPVLVSKIGYQFSVKNVAILKYISTINMEFVYYFILYFSTELKNMSSGAVQNFVSLNQLRNILFPVPPTAEQNRIIVKIKKILILIDRYSFLHNSSEENK